VGEIFTNFTNLGKLIYEKTADMNLRNIY